MDKIYLVIYNDRVQGLFNESDLKDFIIKCTVKSVRIFELVKEIEFKINVELNYKEVENYEIN